ncbi:SPFH domain / Band 7 family protein [Phycisphaerae bacterium RAS1]|nr:SPFH domain / Band 7 family protein [Phycisphaerae bacterium RAS1]
MTETLHTRSRRIAVGGLLLQTAAFGVTLGLAYASGATSVYYLAWYILGGLPLWFVSMLVFRQRELAAYEEADLEALRREKQSTGGGEAIFGDEGAASLGFRVAEARLQWMIRWMAPAFSLLAALYLAINAVLLWTRLGLALDDPRWGALENLPIAVIILAVLLLLMFLVARYASGMGRTPIWQNLRGCGSYMLGNAIFAAATVITLSIALYASDPRWEHGVAYAIPIVMALLAAEMLINFVLDIYRPRAAGVEPRAAFDSRLLGLFAEPGGIATSIAEAINYQFGFEVSQTWFYQLVQRAALPLVWFSAATLWGLSSIVVVLPGENAIIERFGVQLNPEKPFAPGLHVKYPWPIDAAAKYNTGELHQILVGFRQFDFTPPPPADDAARQEARLVLWTQQRLLGGEMFNFVIPPRRSDSTRAPASRPARHDEDSISKSVPVNVVRMLVAVQFKILPDRLASYTSKATEPEQLLRNVAWEEVVRFAAAHDIEQLLSGSDESFHRYLRKRIADRVAELDLGLEVVYVGVQNVQPEPTVAEAYRKVIGAEQEKLTSIRQALVSENQKLSEAAGEKTRGTQLARASDRAGKADVRLNKADLLLRAAPAPALAELDKRFKPLEPLFNQRIDADAVLDFARQRSDDIDLDYQLGIGRSQRQRDAAAEAVRSATAAAAKATAELDAALKALRERSAAFGAAVVEAAIERESARLELAYWNWQLEALLPELEGRAAAVLAASQSERWEIEMSAAADVARINNQRDAFRSFPEIFKTRAYLDVLVRNMLGKRKFFLAFDPTGRDVRIRADIQDQAGARPEDMPTRGQPR